MFQTLLIALAQDRAVGLIYQSLYQVKWNTKIIFKNIISQL